VVEVASQAELALIAGQDILMSAGQGLVLGAGGDIEMAAGGAARLHTGQAIGILGGAVAPGKQAAGTGLTMIAAQGEVSLQAQADKMQVAAQGELTLGSQGQHIDAAAAKRIVIATEGGASITIEGGNITVMCPGKILVKAGKKSFMGGQNIKVEMPVLPKQDMSLRRRYRFSL
jgi:type VI secretion system secreted protein VgrG